MTHSCRVREIGSSVNDGHLSDIEIVDRNKFGNRYTLYNDNEAGKLIQAWTRTRVGSM